MPHGAQPSDTTSDGRVIQGRPRLLGGRAERISDFEIELVGGGVGDWITEQRPELVLDRIRSVPQVVTPRLLDADRHFC
jgi:hypothetical protein